jgi:hypothetical protein
VSQPFFYSRRASREIYFLVATVVGNTSNDMRHHERHRPSFSLHAKSKRSYTTVDDVKGFSTDPSPTVPSKDCWPTRWRERKFTTSTAFRGLSSTYLIFFNFLDTFKSELQPSTPTQREDASANQWWNAASQVFWNRNWETMHDEPYCSCSS